MTACFRPCTWARAVPEVKPPLPLVAIIRPTPDVSADGTVTPLALGPLTSHPGLSSAVSIVMGVPSVKREAHSYLSDTLSSLMSELSAAEKEDCVIVVLIAEVSGRTLSSQAF